MPVWGLFFKVPVQEGFGQSKSLGEKDVEYRTGGLVVVDSPGGGTDHVKEAQLEGPGNRVSQELRNVSTSIRVSLALLSNMEEERSSDSEVWVEHHTGMDIFINNQRTFDQLKESRWVPGSKSLSKGRERIDFR